MSLDAMSLTQEQMERLTNRPAAALVEYIVIHHTAETDMNEDIAKISADEAAAMDFICVGYHFVIKADGSIQVGRPINKLPAANLGLNEESIAICCEGNFHPPDKGYTGEKPTAAQLNAVAHIVNEWLKGKVPHLKYLIGHRDVAPLVHVPSDATACPGDLLYAHMHDLRVATGLHTPPGLA